MLIEVEGTSRYALVLLDEDASNHLIERGLRFPAHFDHAAGR